MSTDLAECPFCGSDRIGIHFKRTSRKAGYQAICLECRVGQTHVFHTSIERAAEAWNTRVQPRPNEHGLAIPLATTGTEPIADVVPCTGVPMGWAVFSEGNEFCLAKVGEHGGACWTVVYRKGSGLHIENAAAEFLESVLRDARPIPPAQLRHTPHSSAL